ncbi:Hypothetical protein LUCI_1637 [Lucifera butyrica]|uniref:Threonine/serine exporter-like N-terminal domain-containing protein n=1 Tax=Lucifera butyrica TaxID=1351585 RepID=A0A498R1E1_9FIRM|nr:threonine/serine exporter family protein [Lucifera butyrica]VBB06406.1 Hypothetical protein LUCI_1637 [Lucifera butyrica]
MDEFSLEDAAAVAILAGEIMLRNGAETYRAEETMNHIARACGVQTAESFVIPTGVFLMVTDATRHSLTVMRRVQDRTINLDRIARVNEVSRCMAEGVVSGRDARSWLEQIAIERTGFSLLPSMMASGIVGGSFAVLQSAFWPEVVLAFVAAVLVRYIAHIVSRLKEVPFIFEFLGSATAALVGIAAQSVWPSVGRDVVIIGGIIPLVPGLTITNAIRDVMAGDLLSGASRGLEALLSSVAIAMGVVVCLTLYG